MMEEQTIEVTAMAHGGSALGRDVHGRVIFVPFAIPGETVRVHTGEGRARYAYAELVEVLQPSPHRIEPRCRHFGTCGGCHYQHIAYPSQLKFKTEVVSDQLERVGKFTDPPVHETLSSPAQWGYRISATFHPSEEGRLGYWSHLEERVIPIYECHIIQPILWQLFEDLDLDLTGILHVTLRVGDDDDLLVALETEDVEPPALEVDFPVSVAMVLPTGEAANLVGENYLAERCAGRAWRVSAGSFFQVNLGAAEHLVHLVGQKAGLSGHEAVLELYSGVGLFTATLSAAAQRVAGIESNPDAVSDAGVNLEDTDNVELYQGPVEEILPALTGIPFDVVVIDPPRGGVDPTVIDSLLEIRAPRIVYVSCDPATFARDARRLVRGGYQLGEVSPVDMFPQTYHIETVSLLTL
jgi:23S rRNA (uracil1939-C5)-methyltransferase